MTKKTFIEVLKKNLHMIPIEDMNDLIYDYEEHFTLGEAEGRTEDEICKSLGNPYDIAKQVRADYVIAEAVEESTSSNILRAVLASLGLGLFNLIFVLGPFLGLAGVLIGLWAASLGVTLSGICLVLGMAFRPLLELIPYVVVSMPFGNMAAILIGIGFTAMGLLMGIGTYYLTKGGLSLTARYLQFNYNIISNRKDNPRKGARDEN